MSNELIKEFAIKHGFSDIKELGNYQDYTIFAPLYSEKNRIVGYPKYILVRNDEISLRLDKNMEITKFFYS